MAGRSNLGQVRLLFERGATRNVCRILRQQDADEIFLLRDLALQIGDGGRRVEDQLFRLTHVDQRGGAAGRRHLGKPQRFTTRRQSVRRDLELKIERPQLEIGARHLADGAEGRLLCRIGNDRRDQSRFVDRIRMP